jgi:hypothetical protein
MLIPALLRAGEAAGREQAWLSLLQRVTVLYYWMGAGRRLRSISQLDQLLARVDRVASTTHGVIDLDTDQITLPKPDDACELRVLRSGREVGMAPLRWGGLPFDAERFANRVRQQYANGST